MALGRGRGLKLSLVDVSPDIGGACRARGSRKTFGDANAFRMFP
jgi:hypothetical protein